MWRLFNKKPQDWELLYQTQSIQIDDAVASMVNAVALGNYILEGDEVDEETIESLVAFIKDAMDTLDEA